MLARFRMEPQLEAEHLDLTPGQSRVAVALVEGSTVRQIAETTGRSEHTTQYYLKEIYRRLNIST